MGWARYFHAEGSEGRYSRHLITAKDFVFALLLGDRNFGYLFIAFLLSVQFYSSVSTGQYSILFTGLECYLCYNDMKSMTWSEIQTSEYDEYGVKTGTGNSSKQE